MSPPTPTIIYPGVAKLGKAPDLGSGNFARSNRVTRTIHKILKGIMIMSKEIQALKLKNRIALLSERNKDNGRVVQKLKRQYKMLTGEEFAAAGPETV